MVHRNTCTCSYLEIQTHRNDPAEEIARKEAEHHRNAAQDEHQEQAALDQDLRDAHHDREAHAREGEGSGSEDEGRIDVPRVVVPRRGLVEGLGEGRRAVRAHHGDDGDDVPDEEGREEGIAASGRLRNSRKANNQKIEIMKRDKRSNGFHTVLSSSTHSSQPHTFLVHKDRGGDQIAKAKWSNPSTRTLHGAQQRKERKRSTM